MKAYKQNPTDFKGSISDVAMIIRVALTGKTRTPDLHEMMEVMGEKFVKERLAYSASIL